MDAPKVCHSRLDGDGGVERGICAGAADTCYSAGADRASAGHADDELRADAIDPAGQYRAAGLNYRPARRAIR